MQVGIFFGGRSREREVSFAGGRTVYDLLDKSLYSPIPIFIDSYGKFILINWENLYKGSIRDFYPPSESINLESAFQTYIEATELNMPKDEAIKLVGTEIYPHQFSEYFDFAFLALHGPYGEDGRIQGLLEYFEIPYSGCGILGSAIGINKDTQKQLMGNMHIRAAKSTAITLNEWLQKSSDDKAKYVRNIKIENQLPIVVKSATQGSSIGVSIIKEWDDSQILEAIDKSFFIKSIDVVKFRALSESDRNAFINEIIDLQSGISIPGIIRNEAGDVFQVNAPKELINKLVNSRQDTLQYQALDAEHTVLIEAFIAGREFSCIVVDADGENVIALPPTEIIKKTDIFDYRSKYLPGISRKVTPIDLPNDIIREIMTACVKLYQKLHFDVYARIDGIITAEGKIFLNDPNTTSGMMPSSFFFHQAAEIGLTPTQFLNFIIVNSLRSRYNSTGNYSYKNWQLELEHKLHQAKNHQSDKKTVGVILGGFSSERHISVESGRNVFEKLNSSGKYKVLPYLLDADEDGNFIFYQLPINLLLKDNADDIREKCETFHQSEIINEIVTSANHITTKYSEADYEFTPKKLSLVGLASSIDFAFIALHGRPGEDGSLQVELEKYEIPYNGSGIESSAITIDKFKTNEILRQNGIEVANHLLIYKSEWLLDSRKTIAEIERLFQYPIIAKPSDDGCSSAVKKLSDRYDLKLYLLGMFRTDEEMPIELRQELKLQPNEEFPRKEYFVIEDLISSNSADHFIEVTGGMYTVRNEDGSHNYEVFYPSEALAQKGILSLEEKFLAGEGQNITPARFSKLPEINEQVSVEVKDVLRKTATVMNVEGYCRIDAFVRIWNSPLKVETIVIEINSLPGLTPATCIFHQAALNKLTPFDFLDK